MLERIFDAAGRMVVERGVGSLTMDAVAATAGISKGGLLHHFRSKESLVTALLLRKLQELQDGLARTTENLPDSPGKTLQGMIAYAAEQYGVKDSFPRALLVATVETSRSLEAFQEMFRDMLAKIESESKTTDQARQADILLFATMGLLMSQSLGIAELADDRRLALFSLLKACATFAPPLPTADGRQRANRAARFRPDPTVS